MKSVEQAPEPLALLSINNVYLLIGFIVMFLVIKTLQDSAHPKRLSTALFWFLFGSVFMFGDVSITLVGEQITYLWVGVSVIVIALLAGMNMVSMGTYDVPDEQFKALDAKRFGNKLFIPAVIIPIVTVICTIILDDLHLGTLYFFDQSHVTLSALTLACTVALLISWRITKGSPLQALSESRRLVDSIGWAAILPQMLAMLGGVFIVANTGTAIQDLVTLFISPDNRFMLVALYCVGMALFTMIMGNAFAAFPVMTAGVALPFLIQGHGAAPAPLVAIGMYSGYCGTLMTPMAANFNIVPAALLDLKDKYQVIKVQIPTAITLLIINIFLMYGVVF
ncbi:DUF979 domain-containing protein [Pseudoalteromonas peptidolytica]|uniref:DUF979 domain-containing protein n=1 Tax=Pseudoalteromonas peptidolytica F12-50-A1 TaxID=1315280 RepID=A0A8I0T3M4_9GAMM|nr:DUF979 domain-containing protein [Pseudoalteromonas peptidolytica]MBE0346501.1 hypothetical protein [Pseudoalteromonas peptidolytica F12-50-A1]NLR14563.1 DUF979 family protein [Pseudoalteromonas peptidolytica]GEK09283.1 membrane protein [Pseudoalteromonas peptidolytica]